VKSTFSEHATSIDEGAIGDDSRQMVDRFEVDLIDRHPEWSVILAGTNDVFGRIVRKQAWKHL
jgi:hypothetical protein